MQRDDNFQKENDVAPIQPFGVCAFVVWLLTMVRDIKTFRAGWNLQEGWSESHLTCTPNLGLKLPGLLAKTCLYLYIYCALV